MSIHTYIYTHTHTKKNTCTHSSTTYTHTPREMHARTVHNRHTDAHTLACTHNCTMWYSCGTHKLCLCTHTPYQGHVHTHTHTTTHAHHNTHTEYNNNSWRQVLHLLPQLCLQDLNSLVDFWKTFIFLQTASKWTMKNTNEFIPKQKTIKHGHVIPLAKSEKRVPWTG